MTPCVSEATSVSHKRSIYIINDIHFGDECNYENRKSIKPGNGLAVETFDDFLGKQTAVPIAAGTPLS